MEPVGYLGAELMRDSTQCKEQTQYIKQAVEAQDTDTEHNVTAKRKKNEILYSNLSGPRLKVTVSWITSLLVMRCGITSMSWSQSSSLRNSDI